MVKAMVVYLSLGKQLPSTNGAEKVTVYISDVCLVVVFCQPILVLPEATLILLLASPSESGGR